MNSGDGLWMGCGQLLSPNGGFGHQEGKTVTAVATRLALANYGQDQPLDAISARRMT